MKKFVIHYNYYATADVTVLANSKEEAIEKADQIEISNDEFDLEYDNREAFELEDVPELEEVIDKATAIIKKFNEGAGQEDFYYDSDKGLMMDVGEGFEVELSELSDVEQLNVCQVIINAAPNNGIEL